LCTRCLTLCKRSLETPAIYIHTVYSFKDKDIKKIIHAIKYYKRKDLIDPLVEHIHRAHLPPVLAEHRETPYIFIPIPMSPFRRYMRGYNQAELIARAFSRICNIPIATDILIKKNSARRQVTTHSRGERLLNQRNTYAVTRSVQDMSIVLIDDVTTTGATFDEARKILLKHGAKSVTAVALAH